MPTPRAPHRWKIAILGVAAWAGLSLNASTGFAQTTAKGMTAPAPPVVGAARDYEIKGFRSAAFGMTPAQVRSAITADFGAAAKVMEIANPAERTTALEAAVEHLEPGPGPAKVVYIFGATSRTLVHINVIWATAEEPTTEQREGIVTAAIQITRYFQTLPTPPKASVGAKPTSPNGLLLFDAVDRKGAGIEVTADGISYKTAAGSDGRRVESPPPTGPAVLRVSYIGNAVNPDVYRIKSGAF